MPIRPWIFMLLLSSLVLTACGNKPEQLQLPEDTSTVTQPDATD